MEELSIHPAAARGFARGADEYEAGRPSYPAGAVDMIVREFAIGPGSTVVDVGAGTGKFTRLLVPSGARVVGVEPVAEMREVFSRVLPDIEVMDSTAESLPFGDASVDVVTAAQTFHWVDAVPAVAEVARVLRPGGRFYSCEMTARIIDSRVLRAVSYHPADGDRPTPESLAAACRDAGLRVQAQQTRFAGCWTALVAVAG